MTQTALTVPGRRVTPTAYRRLPADAPEQLWLATRRKGIGSSDVAAILGVADRRTALHVWYDKRGQLPDDDAGEAALWGKLHEDTVAREWQRRNRSVVRRVGLVSRIAADGTAADDWMMCTLDRQVGVCPLNRDAGTVCALEVKTRNAYVAKKWRRSCPDDVLAQGSWQRIVTGYDHIHVACLIGGNDYRQYVITSDAELEADIIKAVTAFWRGNVLGGVKPEVDLEAFGDDLVDLDDRLHPMRGSSVSLEWADVERMITAYESGRLLESRHKRTKTGAKAAMVMALAGTEAILIRGEGPYHSDPAITYFEESRAPKVDLAGLAERWPKAYADCVTERTGRTVRIDPGLRMTEEYLDKYVINPA